MGRKLSSAERKAKQAKASAQRLHTIAIRKSLAAGTWVGRPAQANQAHWKGVLRQTATAAAAKTVYHTFRAHLGPDTWIVMTMGPRGEHSQPRLETVLSRDDLPDCAAEHEVGGHNVGASLDPALMLQVLEGVAPERWRRDASNEVYCDKHPEELTYLMSVAGRGRRALISELQSKYHAASAAAASAAAAAAAPAAAEPAEPADGSTSDCDSVVAEPPSPIPVVSGVVAPPPPPTTPLAHFLLTTETLTTRERFPWIRRDEFYMSWTEFVAVYEDEVPRDQRMSRLRLRDQLVEMGFPVEYCIKADHGAADHPVLRTWINGIRAVRSLIHA